MRETFIILGVDLAESRVGFHLSVRLANMFREVWFALKHSVAG